MVGMSVPGRVRERDAKLVWKDFVKLELTSTATMYLYFPGTTKVQLCLMFPPKIQVLKKSEINYQVH